MAKSALFTNRFNDLVQEAKSMDAQKQFVRGDIRTGYEVDEHIFSQWKIKTSNLIVRACGESSIHSKAWTNAQKATLYSTSHEELMRAFAVLLAAQDDYNSGMIVELRSIIGAELFGSELDQARDLLSNRYKSASAVVAGVVLETALRQMCDKTAIPAGKLDKMNADLVKAGSYNGLVQKRITHLAGIRNSAAHGKPEEFSDDDVREMIDYVEKFLADHV